jgi:Transglycosylase SLT domain
VILALLLAVPIMLAAPAAGQTPDAGEPAAPERVDPDCYPDVALLPDRALADPALVDEPDGVCPPGEDPDLLPNNPDQGGEGPPPPGGPDHQPAPEAPLGPPDVQPDAPAPPAPEQTSGAPADPPDPSGGMGERREAPKNDAPARRQRPDSGGGAYSQPRDEPRPERRRPAARESVLPGPSAITGAPSFIVRGSTVPRFLRGIYQAAEARYGVRWEILAAINEIETYYGENLKISSAGAIGWMQFMPGTWRGYGTDANEDGVRDPYDPEDAIFSAARYLSASGYEHDVRGALFAYNHAHWYVDDVLERARRIAAENVSLPAARRLDAAFATRLARVADRAGVPWQLALAVLRVRGMDGDVPATGPELRTLVRRLARLGARTDARRALRRMAKRSPSGAALGPRLLTREPTFVERVVALAHYNKAVGRVGLVRGLNAVRQKLARRVLASQRLAIYPGGRADIGKGATDVHVLLLLSYLSSRYEEVTVTSLTTGHSLFTASGNVSAHTYGRAVDIAALNGTPILGNQEPGGSTEQALWRILLLPAELEPKQLISLFALGGPSFALADHADHVHAGY